MITNVRRIYCVGDTHGSDYWAEDLHDINWSSDLVVFFGDYFDSYQGIPRGWELENFNKVLNLKREHNDSVILLLGNHDIAYMGKLCVSRQETDPETFNAIRSALISNLDSFQLTEAVQTRSGKKLFCSHAGVTTGWLQDVTGHSLGKSDLLDLLNGEWNRRLRKPSTCLRELWKVSSLRGGSDENGSLIWVDRHEWRKPNNNPFSKAYQIVGHTRCSGFQDPEHRVIGVDSGQTKVIALE